MAKNRLVPAKDPQDEQAVEVMERAIIDIANGARRLLGSRLKKKAVLLLLKDASGVPMRDIELVLDNAAQLDKLYLNR